MLPLSLLAPGLWVCCRQALGTAVVSISSGNQHSAGLSLFSQLQLVALLGRMKSDSDPGTVLGTQAQKGQGTTG